MLRNDSEASMGLVLTLQAHKERVGKTGFSKNQKSTTSLIRAIQRPSDRHVSIGLSHKIYEDFTF